MNETGAAAAPRYISAESPIHFRLNVMQVLGVLGFLFTVVCTIVATAFAVTRWVASKDDVEHAKQDLIQEIRLVRDDVRELRAAALRTANDGPPVAADELKRRAVEESFRQEAMDAAPPKNKAAAAHRRSPPRADKEQVHPQSSDPELDMLARPRPPETAEEGVIRQAQQRVEDAPTVHEALKRILDKESRSRPPGDDERKPETASGLPR